MQRIAHHRFTVALTIAALSACAETATVVEPRANISREEVDGSDLASDVALAPLVTHIVAPRATDPTIDRALANHYVWLDTTAKSNHRLFLFLPTGNGVPQSFQLVGQEAARLGYHVISLMYQNDVILVTACTPPRVALDDRNACYENARLDILDGGDRSATGTGIDVTVPNSIDNRLAKLLEALDAQYPDEGWSAFRGDDGMPKWSHIAAGGHSQGGGEAAIIAKIRLVDRVVLFSSTPDSVDGKAPAWLSEHITPTNRYYALAHDCDGYFQSIVAGWDSLGMKASVTSEPNSTRPPGTPCRTWSSVSRDAPASEESSEPPYGYTHTLITDRTPQSGNFIHRSSHQSTANDAFTPLGSDRTPLLRPAWRYLLTASPRRAEPDDKGVTPNDE